MVPNGCKSSPERFVGVNRRLFVTGKEISPRQLNRQKKIFSKKSPEPPGSQFHQKSDFRKFTQKWGLMVANVRLKGLAVETEDFLSHGRKSALDNLTERKRFF
ncbi:Hypothetical predicted protein [Podarcis lilfordi]|uniref:Uncharacterized protein n=1 Tax=Podarcis lilfordi TaxID=74358 RepID=A0AA35KE47_9SAUR|nr:Hypothetical predicted protein [Podarcis lilfordi]